MSELKNAIKRVEYEVQHMDLQPFQGRIVSVENLKIILAAAKMLPEMVDAVERLHELIENKVNFAMMKCYDSQDRVIFMKTLNVTNEALTKAQELLK